MSDAKPRILQDSKDIVWSLIPLVVLILLFAALAGQCSFSPGGPQGGPVPDFDAQAALRADANSMPFAIRSPELPQDWTSNSGRREDVESSRASRIGWVAPLGYIELIQTSAPLADLRDIGTGIRPSEEQITVAGRQWTIYSGDDIRTVWATDFSDARVGITGNAPRSAFETMAQAMASAPVLAK